MSDPPAPAGSVPRLTISLVTFQGRAWLPGCIAAIEAQSLAAYEVIAHDNASTDGSLELLRAYALRDPRVRVTAGSVNEGYVAPHDRAIAAARGEHVVLLNQDVVLDPDFLAAAARVLEERARVGSVQGRVLRLSSSGERLAIVDTTGLLIGRDRRAVSRDRGASDGPGLMVPGPVWGADGPAPVYRGAALDEARLPASDGTWEVLDRDFGSFKEDVDLAWRLRRLGWESWYEPNAVAWHARGTGDSGARGPLAVARANRAIPAAARALSWRNQRLMQLKNETLSGYLRALPWIAAREVLTIGFLALVDPRALVAMRDLVRAAPSALRKRRHLARLVAAKEADRAEPRGNAVPGEDYAATAPSPDPDRSTRSR